MLIGTYRGTTTKTVYTPQCCIFRNDVMLWQTSFLAVTKKWLRNKFFVVTALGFDRSGVGRARA
jgi:hypothetical protein